MLTYAAKCYSGYAGGVGVEGEEAQVIVCEALSY
jgi:hypothetical protein